jgi:cytoskeletal protein RodZ
MPTLGRTLATERLRQNLDLEEVAKVTRISPRFLHAIETDDFDQLPGRVFARNFVRQYAQFLNLDPDAALAQFYREQSSPQDQDPLPQLLQPETEREPRGFSLNLPAVAGVFGGEVVTSFLTFLVTIGLCAGGIWVFNNWGTVRTRIAPGRPLASASRAASPPPPATPAPAPEATSPDAESPTVDTSAPASTTLDSPEITAGGAAVHVLLAASEACWTRITADGKVLFAGTLNAGETREINAATVIDLRAGNAGALAVKLNGSDIPPLGPKGQIRTVVLTPEGAQVRTPTPDPVSEPL